jgi:D123
MAYEDSIELTFPDYWYEDLAEHTFASALIPLGGADLVALCSVDPAFRAARGLAGVMPLSEDLQRLIDLELKALKGPAFLRTSYGMAKECPFAYAPVTTLREVEGVLRWPDARLLRFFRERLASGDPASLFLRRWQDIPPWAEFRAFVRGRRIIGVSQYPTHTFHPEIPSQAAELQQAIVQLFHEIMHLLPLDDVIVEICAAPTPKGLKMQVVELNPLLPVSDAGLFTWARGGDFDGSFRYLRHGPTARQASRFLQGAAVNDPWHLA